MSVFSGGLTLPSASFSLYFTSMQLLFHVVVSFLLFPFLSCTLRGLPCSFSLGFIISLACLFCCITIFKFFFFPPTALNFLSVVLLNEITARAVGVDVADTRMSKAQGAAINILSVSCGRQTLKRCLKTWFLSPSERSDVGLNFCIVQP